MTASAAATPAPTATRRRRRIERARPLTSSRSEAGAADVAGAVVQLVAEHALELVVVGVHRSSSLAAGVQVLGCAGAQGGQRTAGLGLDGPDGDAEHVGRLGLGQLLVVAQHDDGPRLAGQRLHDLPQLAALTLVVVSWRLSGISSVVFSRFFQPRRHSELFSLTRIRRT